MSQMSKLELMQATRMHLQHAFRSIHRAKELATELRHHADSLESLELMLQQLQSYAWSLTTEIEKIAPGCKPRG